MLSIEGSIVAIQKCQSFSRSNATLYWRELEGIVSGSGCKAGWKMRVLVTF